MSLGAFRKTNKVFSTATICCTSTEEPNYCTAVTCIDLPCSPLPRRLSRTHCTDRIKNVQQKAANGDNRRTLPKNPIRRFRDPVPAEMASQLVVVRGTPSILC